MTPADFASAPSGTRVLMAGVLLDHCGRDARSVAFGDRCISAAPEDVEPAELGQVSFSGDVWDLVCLDGDQVGIRRPAPPGGKPIRVFVSANAVTPLQTQG